MSDIILIALIVLSGIFVAQKYLVDRERLRKSHSVTITAQTGDAENTAIQLNFNADDTFQARKQKLDEAYALFRARRKDYFDEFEAAKAAQIKKNEEELAQPAPVMNLVPQNNA